MSEALWRRNPSRLYCWNAKCRARFTVDSRGLTCAGCQIATYCNSTCQKIDWVDEHKPRCTARDDWQHRPDVQVCLDLRHHLANFLTLSECPLEMAARSALRLGRPDSLASTHFMAVDLAYRAPPAERSSVWSRQGPKGDEGRFFDIVSVKVRPDSHLLKYKHWKVKPSEKKAYWEEAQNQIGTNGSAAFVIYHVIWMDDGVLENSK